jgi:hypothetical protein
MIHDLGNLIPDPSIKVVTGSSTTTWPYPLPKTMEDEQSPEFVVMPRAVCQEIYDAFTTDLEARDGYGGEVVLRENAVDPVTLHHIFGAIIEGNLAGALELYRELRE